MMIMGSNLEWHIRQTMETSPPYCTRMESIDQYVVMFEKLRTTTISSVLSIRPSVCLYVCLSVRIWQLGVHWTDFHDFSYFSKICQKYSRTTGTLQEDIRTFNDEISANSSQSETCFGQMVQRKSKHAFYMHFFFRKSCCLGNNVKNIVKPTGHKWCW